MYNSQKEEGLKCGPKLFQVSLTKVYILIEYIQKHQNKAQDTENQIMD